MIRRIFLSVCLLLSLISLGADRTGMVQAKDLRRQSTPAENLSNGFFHDDFSSASLAPEWFWVREDPSMWSLTARPGYLRISTQYGTHDGGSVAKNLLLRDSPGSSYELSTKVELSSTQNYQEAVLLLYQDDDNYIKLCKLYHSVLGGNVYLLVREENGVFVDDFVSPATEQASELRITVNGDLVIGAYRAATGEWVDLGNIELDGLSQYPYIGVTAHNGVETTDVPSIPADFDFVSAVSVSIPGFLNLPYEHGESDTGLNRLSSYFDHEYPIYDLEPSPATGTLMRYDGRSGSYSYSGHDGYDFARGITEGSPVWAAASGTVTWDVTDAHYCWVTGTWVRACIATVDHHNGYQTQYWHLAKVTGSNTNPNCRTGSAEVNAEDVIGQVGMTGCTTGPHIHFVVRHDSVGVFGTDSKVDPYFLFPPGKTDPWTETFQDKNGVWHTGATSTWLWEFKEPERMRATAEDGGQLSTDWGVAIEVPPAAVLDVAFVGASIISEPDSSVAEALANTIHVPVTPAVWISAVYTDGTPIPAFENPVAVTLAYTDAEVTYIDEATLAVYQWDAAGENWIALATELDPSTKTAQASVSSPGILSLRGEPVNPAPQVFAVEPASGSNLGGVQLTITGSDFLSDLWVDLGPYMSLNVELVSSISLSATVPAGLPAGVYTLTVQNPDGQMAQLPDAYTITSPELTEHIYLPLILREVP